MINERTIYTTNSKLSITSMLDDDVLQEPIVDEQNRQSYPFLREIEFAFSEDKFTVYSKTTYKRYVVDEKGMADIESVDTWASVDYLGSFDSEQLYQLHAFIGSLLKK